MSDGNGATSILERIFKGENLTEEEAGGIMGAIMEGRVEAPQLAALLAALRMKGETAEEIAGFARAMRARSVRVHPAREGLVDTCGTGGDGLNTFNISTVSAIVAAAMGIPVAKHGNRSVSSRCGSADVLEGVGVRIDLEPKAVTRLIEEKGMGFLFAPMHHPAMKHAAPVRKALGVRTVFNLLGPLTNPAGVRRQLVGVFHPDLTELFCRVLGRLGLERAFVVHGLDGSDEISLTGETRISVLEEGRIRTYRFTPEEAGLRRAPLSALAGGDREENAAILWNILRGAQGPKRDAVLLNAGFVALLADRARDGAEGVRLAAETIDSGRAVAFLEELCRASQSLADGEGETA